MKKIVALVLAIIMMMSVMSFSMAETAEKTVLRVAYMITQNPAEDHKLIEEAINKLMEAKGLNFTVELICVDYPSWGTQTQLMFSDGSVDLINLHGSANLSSLVDSESIAPLDDLIAEYGQGIVDTLGGYLQATKVNGKIYGTPNLAAFSQACSFIMNKDMGDEAGVNYDAITDVATLTEELKKIKEKFPDNAAITTGKGACYYQPNCYDKIGGGLYASLKMDPEKKNTTVVNFFATDDFKNDMSFAKQWAEGNFFRKDAINAQEANFAPMGAGTAFGGFYGSASPEILCGTFSQLFSFNVCAVALEPNTWVTTSNMHNNIWVIPELSEKKVEAMQFLNELYINADLENVVCNGIEGVHYRVTEDGNADYMTADDSILTIGWPSGAMANFWPNMMISYPWAPAPANQYESWLATNDHAVPSVALGFVFDSTEVVDQIVACDNVVEKYYYAIMLNVGDPDEMLNRFLAELDAAGVNDIIEEAQKQLDDWLAVNAQ